MDKQQLIQDNFKTSLSLKTQLMQDVVFIENIAQIAEVLVNAYQSDKKVLWCGNGGSAADAQHLAAELSGRYYFDRPPLFSEALHVNTSYLTAVGNDYGYDLVFARLLRAMGQKGDILIGLSTSGNSENVVKALGVAKELGVITVSFTGKGGGKMGDLSDYWVEIPSKDTPRIQEAQMLVGHSLCQIVEQALFGGG